MLCTGDLGGEHVANRGDEITTKFKVDISELKTGISEANKNIKLANAEFKAASAGMDDWSKSSEGISIKLKQLGSVLTEQNKKLESYKKQQQEIDKAYVENGKRAEELKSKMAELASQGISKTSAEYKKYEKALNDVEKEQTANKKASDNLKITILNQQAAVNKTEKDIRDYNKTLNELESESKQADKASDQFRDSLEDVSDAANETKSKVSGLAKELGSGLKTGLLSLGAAAATAVAGFLASQEFVEDMGKLETAFTTSGHSAETAKKSYEGMVGILGETDQSVEAVNHLAQLTKNQEELAQWTDIAAGVYATFGDSLPLEGLTEAANETAKVGQVTGPLADALNWAGVSEEKFNEQLAACNSEQERATLITQTLNGLYEKSGKKYQELNADLIASRQATSDFNTAMAEVGKVLMPINTAIKQFGADLLNSLVPVLKEAGEGLKGLANGIITGFGWIIDNGPVIISTIAGIAAGFMAFKIVGVITSLVGVFKSLFTTIQAGTGIMQALNIVMGANPIGLIVTLIAGLVTAFITLWNTSEEFRNFWIGLWEAIKTAAQTAWTAITGFFSNAWATIQGIWGAVSGFFTGVWDGIKNVFANVGNWFGEKFTEANENAKLAWSTAKEWATETWGKIQQGFAKVGSWFGEKFTEAAKNRDKAWENTKEWASNTWAKITEVFSGIGSWFGQKFQEANQNAQLAWATVGEWASATWWKIQQGFANVATWFGEKFTEAAINRDKAWETTKEWASSTWAKITEVFSGVGSWFGQKFQEAWTNIQNVFSNFGSFFENLWNNIKNTFSTLGTALGDAIGGAVKSGINRVIDMIEKTVNQAINIINSAINMINSIPGVNVGNINRIRLPRLEKGGILKKGQIGLLEGSGAEAVVPLEKNKQWIRKVSDELKSQLLGVNGRLVANSYPAASTTNNFTQVINAPKSPSRIELYRQTKNLLALKGGY